MLWMKAKLTNEIKWKKIREENMKVVNVAPIWKQVLNACADKIVNVWLDIGYLNAEILKDPNISTHIALEH